MPARKRAASEMEVEEHVEAPSTLHRLRNMWQFANLAQYIAIFGDAVKIDKDFDIEELESESLKPGPSEKLAQIGLALLKHVSSHKGLTPAIFDEYTRRQFVAKAPERNPFGEDEEPNKFDDFDIFTKIRVLQQLSIWTLNNPNSIRERLAAPDSEQTLWRMEPTGWDSQDRVLFVLDDNRMYRRTDPLPPAPSQQKTKTKPKSKAKKSRGTRASKRQKQATPEIEEEEEEEEAVAVQEPQVTEDDGFGGMKWECLCVTLEDYRDYLSSIRKSRDPNEKILYKRIEEEVIPVMEGLAEEQARKQARKARELENLQKLATAKRSSRISARVEKQKEVEEAEAAERKRQDELRMAKAEQAKQKKLEEAHDSRRMTREQRLRERETAKILKEEELRKLQENEQKLASNNARLSERHLKAMMKQHEADLKRLNEEEDWFFDCEKCGIYGSNLNDNSPQVSCEKCSVWQHVKCHGISEEEVEDPKFEFICTSCKRKEETNQPKLPPLKLRLTSASPASQANGEEAPALSRRLETVSIPAPRPVSQNYQPHFQPAQPWVDGPSLSPRGQALGPPGIQNSEAAYGSPTRIPDGSSSPIRQRPASSSRPAESSFRSNGMGSSPPPFNLPQAPTSPFKSIRMPLPQQNGGTYGSSNPFGPPQHTPVAQSFNQSFHQSFSRPGTATKPAGSPVKHSPANSPRPANGLPAVYNFNSPHSSFPPSSAQRPSFSPMKHSSPAPMPHMSSPAPAPVRIAPSPSQMPAQILPDAIPAPLKHDGARPMSSHEMSETPIFPPVKSLNPDSSPQILSPPVKKSSPAPDRHRLAPMGEKGVGNGSL
ncbi:PHD-finger domain-containing protein [Stagonosporopsis vannaccii]|nr:PHD-finger domain-containing protein [Stagonosporopsis vannaccii]